MPIPRSQNDTSKTAEQDFIMGRLINRTGSAEGPIMPPAMRGPNRVPIVSRLRVIKKQAFFGGTELVIGWDDPTDTSDFVSHFVLYGIALNTGADQTPIFLGQTEIAPITIRITVKEKQRVAIIVQTVLHNGFSSLLTTSPSVTVETIDGTLATSDIPDGSITIPKLANGTPGQLITWNPAGVATTIGPGTLNYYLVGSGAGAVPQFKSEEALHTVAAKTSSFTAGTDSVFLCNCTSGSITATLPAISGIAGRRYTIKKVDATSNPVIIDGNGSETIDGSTTVIITSQYDAAQLVAGATEWSIV